MARQPAPPEIVRPRIIRPPDAAHGEPEEPWLERARAAALTIPDARRIRHAEVFGHPARQHIHDVLRLVERGVRVKATGFGRVDFDVREVLSTIYTINPEALMFGTDLPCTRAPRPFRDNDLRLIIDTLGEQECARVLFENAMEFYAGI